jgi:hypothetical protein
LRTPAISYGHVNGLGAELTFPEGGEVGHSHLYGSLKEAIDALRRPIDFAKAGMAAFYVDFRRRMQAAFPDEHVGYSFGAQGPLTTAWELRGEGFFTDIFDDPPAAKEFLRLATASMIEFRRFVCSLDQAPMINPTSGGMSDDLASMIPPDLWPEFVLPYWEQHYQASTTGRRGAHVEDLRPAQLKYLEDIGLWRYDPSISPQLHPRLIADGCRVPFQWRLGSFHFRELTDRDVEDFVYQAAADGASAVSTVTEASLCNETDARKLRTFVRAAKDAKAMVGAGLARTDVGQRVSPAGKAKFWEHWSGYKG